MAEILLFEDLGPLRRILSFVLREDGHTVTEGGNGALAADKEIVSAAQLIVTDIDMPDVSGPEAIQAARRINPDIKVIVMSGGGGARDGDDYLAKCMDLGVSKILLKPFEPDQLLASVNDVLAE